MCDRSQTPDAGSGGNEWGGVWKDGPVGHEGEWVAVAWRDTGERWTQSGLDGCMFAIAHIMSRAVVNGTWRKVSEVMQRSKAAQEGPADQAA